METTHVLAKSTRAHGVVVSHPLRMRKALGSIPSVSTYADAPRARSYFAEKRRGGAQRIGCAGTVPRATSASAALCTGALDTSWDEIRAGVAHIDSEGIRTPAGRAHTLTTRSHCPGGCGGAASRKPRISDVPRTSSLPQRSPCSNEVVKGTWCSGITSASHAEGPGLNPQCVHF